MLLPTHEFVNLNVARDSRSLVFTQGKRKEKDNGECEMTGSVRSQTVYPDSLGVSGKVLPGIYTRNTQHDSFSCM